MNEESFKQVGAEVDALLKKRLGSNKKYLFTITHQIDDKPDMKNVFSTFIGHNLEEKDTFLSINNIFNAFMTSCMNFRNGYYGGVQPLQQDPTKGNNKGSYQ